jgi:hypothetical protein
MGCEGLREKIWLISNLYYDASTSKVSKKWMASFCGVRIGLAEIPLTTNAQRHKNKESHELILLSGELCLCGFVGALRQPQKTSHLVRINAYVILCGF